MMEENRNTPPALNGVRVLELGTTIAGPFCARLLADIFADPHYKARGMLAQIPDDDLGTVTIAAPVPRLSETPGRIRHSGRHIGQDTRRILMELAGVSEEYVASLEAAKVIRCAESANKRVESDEERS